jgi:DtxR family Mn-dependent transcriptional regulator
MEEEPTRSLAALAVGDDLEVVDRQPFDGPLTVRFGAALQVLGGPLVAAIRVA